MMTFDDRDPGYCPPACHASNSAHFALICAVLQHYNGHTTFQSQLHLLDFLHTACTIIERLNDFW